jgi:glycosyltransferase involved in cell wall biosynthesis
VNILVTSLPDLKKIHPQRPHHLLRYLSRHHNITVISVNAWWLEEKEDEFLKETFKNIRFYYLSDRKINPVLQELSVLWGRNFRNRITLKDFDVHINFNSLIAGYSVTKRLKALGIPTIFDICDDLPERIGVSAQIPSFLRPVGKEVGKFMMARSIKVAKKITYVTKSLGDSYTFPHDKSVLIPNGVDTELFHGSPCDHLKADLGLGDSFVIGFVGVLSDWVDLEPAFGALKDLVERELKIKLLVVGGGERLDYFKTLAKQYALTEQVISTGSTPYDQGPRYISCMDVCLICRKVTQDSHHSLPLKLFEYMACEKPVISTPLAGIKEAVEDRVLYATHAEQFAAKILELYKDEKLSEKLGKEGRRFVEQNYSWASICRRFDEVVAAAKK